MVDLTAVKAMLFDALEEAINGKHTDLVRNGDTLHWIDDIQPNDPCETINLQCFAATVAEWFAKNTATSNEHDGTFPMTETVNTYLSSRIKK